MKHLRKISDCAIIGTMGALVLVSMNACSGDNAQSSGRGDNTAVANAAQRGAFVVIQENEDGSYKILEEHPSENTRILLKKPDGSERMLTQEEIDALVAEENQKIDNGTSQLTNPTGGGLSLGETILASAAGAIIGSWIGSKLFNNNNFASQQRGAYSSPQAYERSQNVRQNTARAASGATSGRSGFFSPQSGASSATQSATSRQSTSSGTSSASSSSGVGG
ncbi:MAG: hypothetical protein HDT11_04185 [Helicobacter sp.]|nr:hypothetical protein [Helicobacter sp.]MBD5168078.1 hypothetical protein [Helicobacter sp.]MDE5817468.1 UPF0323 family lipoprotein [Helicobacter sp.]MDE6045029.1 UPF0323 family lipoprotein [Helicobacter sp.]MDE7196700.1 UPF0323 family lipoprotein [Helicobacter sp.]